jgi:GMP synthase (glutamine-hydrolysing)
MKKLLVCQHVPHEILGTLNPLLKRAGFRIRYVNFGRQPDVQPDLTGYHGLVVLGGPMSVNESGRLPHLRTEMHLIEDAMKKSLPVLGICLGAQLIAKTLGANVYPNNEKEIGWYEVTPTEEASGDMVFRHFHQTETIFQWHGDTFDIPHGARHLATSRACVNQAFRYASNVYALQFHLEVDEPMIHRWLKVPENREEIARLNGNISADHIKSETPRYIQRLHELSNRAFGEFIEFFGIQKTRRALFCR